VTGSCPDCGAASGEHHNGNCDVARCKGCGFQMIQCDEHLGMATTRWWGEWPGDTEVELGLADDLNDLYRKANTGALVWDVALERFVRP